MFGHLDKRILQSLIFTFLEKPNPEDHIKKFNTPKKLFKNLKSNFFEIQKIIFVFSFRSFKNNIFL